MSTRKIRSLGLVSVGVIAGVLLSVGLSAVAQRGFAFASRRTQTVFQRIFGDQK